MTSLHRGEWLGLAVLAGLVALHLAYIQAGRTEIAWDAFQGGFTIYGILMGFGLWFRLFGRLPRFSTTLVALSFYPIFANLLSLINFLQFPLDRPLIDPLLMRLDAMVGYDWAAGVAWLAENPGLSRGMRTVYFAALPQLAILLVVLGMTGRFVALHRMMLTGMVAGLVMIAFWSVFPSFGPAAFVPLDPEVAARAGMVVTNDYGAQLLRLAEEGLERIDRHAMLGAIAFPSFHIVMAALAFWFARGTWLFWPMTASGVVMVPATALHGGHHLVDLAGGVLLFAAAAWVAARVLPEDQVITSGAERPVRTESPVSASTA